MPSFHVSTECRITQCLNLPFGLYARYGGPGQLVACWSFLRNVVGEGGGLSR
jgi:hypothetical protein